MNAILGVSIFIVCCWVGLKISAKMRDNLHFAQDFRAFLDKMENNVNFEQKSVADVIKEEQTYCHASFREFLLGKCTKTDELTRLASSFIQSIGHRDRETEINHIAQTKVALAPLLNQQEENQKKGAMITKLGALVGLGLCIIVL